MNGLGQGNGLARLNLLLSMGKNLKQRQRLLRLLIGVYIHQDRAGLPILSNDDGLSVLLELIEHFRSVGLDEADGLDLAGKADDPPPGLNIVRIKSCRNSGENLIIVTIFDRMQE